MAILNNNPLIGSGGQQGYSINNSLRFRASASAYLSRTPASAGNRRTYTFSAWIKRGSLSTNSDIFNVRIDGDNQFRFYFNSSDQIDVYNQISGTIGARLITTAVYRDPSAWYHIVLAIDTTNATAGNRMRLYVNESEVNVFGTDTQPSQNYDNQINTTNLHSIGNFSAAYFDGYMADINFIDGQQLTPSSFGETDTTTGVWKPKAYSGTYGTNGFYLKFSDIATTSGSNAGLGKDFSGNSNYWTTNNISVTSGTTYDAMTDVPTNTSATVANYCVLNPLNKGTAASASNANLNYSCGANSVINCTMGITSGKWYWEIQNPTAQSVIGIVNSSAPLTIYIGQNANGWGYYGSTGNKLNGSSVAYGSSFTTTDIIGVAFDADAGTLTFYKNNVSQGVAFTGIPANTYFPAVSDDTLGGATGAINFGQRPFAYTPPTGYLALNTFNLPNPTILQGNKYMDATLYTGNGYPTGGTQVVVNAGQFKPDLIWVKERSGTGWNIFTDSVRGLTKNIYSNSTNAEGTNNGTDITAINSNGFSLGADTGGDGVNRNGATVVAWQWQAGQGSTSSNTSGSITSTVSVNTTAGFSIVTYTGTGANATVGHGLGVAPSMMIVKQRNSAQSWSVYHASLGATKRLYLNLTDAVETTSTAWNNTAPTSTVYSVGTSAATNGSGNTYVAYCWAEIAGFSKFGSYTGNGSTDGPFIYTGFRPKFIICKKTSDTSDWIINDTSRDTFNVTSKRLFTNTSDAESGTYDSYDILSNGFKMRNTNSLNISSASYIYMAFAENPFKNSLAR